MRLKHAKMGWLITGLILWSCSMIVIGYVISLERLSCQAETIDYMSKSVDWATQKYGINWELQYK